MSIMECVVSNVAIASMLALVAALVGRITTKPQVTHTLWVLVLVKLVTPPVVHIPVSYPVFESVTLEVPVGSAVVTKHEPTEELAAHSARVPDVLNSSPKQQAGVRDSTPASAPQKSWAKALVSVWVAGSLMWFLLATTRLIRFKTLLHYARPASRQLLVEVSTIAVSYGLRSLPRVLVVDAKIPPLIWGFCGRSSMVLPSGLLNRLGTEERAGLLAHELAHLRRYDHWIRWLEFVILGIYWWNPVAWWARAQIQQAEEDCCDGWVLWAFPGKARLYAQTLVDTVEFLAGSFEPKPDMATAFNQGNSLKRRIEMIVSNKPSRRLSWKMRVILVLLAGVITPISLLGSPVSPMKRSEKEVTNQEEKDDSGAVKEQTKEQSPAIQQTPMPVQDFRVTKEDRRYAAKTFEEWQTILLTDLDSKTQIEALTAIEAFAKHGYAPEALPAVKQCFTSSSAPAVLVRAVQVLRVMGEPAVPVLIEGLQHESSTVRVEVVHELGKLGAIAKPSITALLTALEKIESERLTRSVNGQLVAEAAMIIQAFRNIGVYNPDVRNALQELAQKSKEEDVLRTLAWNALIELCEKSPEIGAVLIPAIVKGDQCALSAVVQTQDQNFIRTTLGKALDELELSADNTHALSLCVVLGDNGGLKDHLEKAEKVVRSVGAMPPASGQSADDIGRKLGRMIVELRKLGVGI
ncbi:MAG: M56 family metallopeptidase [Pirellulaceae bacterium]